MENDNDNNALKFVAKIAKSFGIILATVFIYALISMAIYSSTFELIYINSYLALSPVTSKLVDILFPITSMFNILAHMVAIIVLKSYFAGYPLDRNHMKSIYFYIILFIIIFITFMLNIIICRKLSKIIDIAHIDSCSTIDCVFISQITFITLLGIIVNAGLAGSAFVHLLTDMLMTYARSASHLASHSASRLASHSAQ